MTKEHKLFFADAALEIRARVHAGGGVALKINQVAQKFFIGGAEKMIEADVIQGRSRGKTRNMSTQIGRLLVGAHHRGHRVPAHQRADAMLHLRIAG